MEQLNNLDVIFIVIAGISALVGIARGMTKEMLSIAGWILAAAALFYLVPLLNPFTQKYIASKILSSVVTGLGVILVFSIIWILTVDKMASMIRSSKLNSLDRIFGFAFGLARGFLIIVLIALMITTLVPEGKDKGIFAESQLFKIAESCSEPLKNMVPKSWVDTFKEKSESLGFGGGDEVTREEKTGDEKGTTKEDKKVDAQKEGKAANIVNSLKAIDSNLETLQKTGEDLFNQLAQPKAQSGAEENIEEEVGYSSDLDKLLDALEDKVVLTDDKTAVEIPVHKQHNLELHETVAD